MSYESIKKLADATGRNINELIVLARGNDPFFCGTPAHVRDAEWFATWWRRLGYEGRSGVHLRAIHYRLVSQDTPPVMPSVKPYINTLECWSYLGRASKMARVIGVVDAEAFEDHRNPDPILRAEYPVKFQPSLELCDWDEWGLPEIKMDRDNFELPLPEFSISGYDYSPAHQPYHIEVWIEKSTMDSVLLPICQQHCVNLVASIGFQSIPSTIALLRRAEFYGKPARILYISDFDPAGAFMPDAVARQIEFWRHKLGIKVEVKLQPLVLTREQVIEYRLPSIPIKESDRRASGFESRYGMLATELDALEALRPGTLARLVCDAIKPYRDDDLEDSWEEAQADANTVADDAREWVARESRDEWQAIQTEVRTVLDGYHGRVAALNAELKRDLAPYQERMQAVRHDIQAAIDLVDDVLELPDAPESSLDEPDEDDWLFDSSRDYFEQLAHYKTRRDAVTECAQADKTDHARVAEQSTPFQPEVQP